MAGCERPGAAGAANWVRDRAVWGARLAAELRKNFSGDVCTNAMAEAANQARREQGMRAASWRPKQRRPADVSLSCKALGLGGYDYK